MRHEHQRRRTEIPRWMLVVWKGEDRVSCIPLGYKDLVSEKGGMVVAIEDAELTGPITVFQPYMGQFHPRRSDAQEDHS